MRPLSIGIDTELGAPEAAAYTAIDSPVSLLRDYAESVTSTPSASQPSRPRATGFYHRFASVAPPLSTITEHSSPPLPPLHSYHTRRTSLPTARPPVLLAVIHVLLVLIAYNSAVSHTPFVDTATSATVDQHGQLTLTSHLYSPLCTALTHPPLHTYHTTALLLLCLCAALGFHLVGWLLLAGSVLAVCECVRCGRCVGGSGQYLRRLGWCAVFGWVALYAWKCRRKKLDDKIV